MTTEIKPKKPRAKKKPDVQREAIVKRSLRYFFKDPEKLELARRLAEKHKESANLEDMRQRANKDYQTQIKGVANDITLISEKVREGYEFREIECRVVFDKPKPGLKTIIRLDDNKVEAVEQMTNEEKQLPIVEVETAVAESKAAAKAEPTDHIVSINELEAGLDVLKATRRASPSMLQRRLKIGYNRASAIMDEFQKRGIVGPENGSSPREILVDLTTYKLTDKPIRAGAPGVVSVPADGLAPDSD